ncbi:hypothetical protein ER57_08120 [Smithella sp. SCADC]|jgi:hypothetical protein|nr:hypothetical protein ER57_08120 [Smithella sp. SCADC]
MADTLEFKISEGLIKPIIETKINEAIVASMGGHERLISDMVAMYMNQKVDSNGNTTTYSSGKPRLAWLSETMINEAIKNTLQEYLKSKQEFLQKEFERFFNSKKGSSQIVKAMQEGLCAGLGECWRVSIKFTPPEK